MYMSVYFEIVVVIYMYVYKNVNITMYINSNKHYLIAYKICNTSLYTSLHLYACLNKLHFSLQGFGKMILIMCILSGVNIFAWLNKPQPSWWSWCLENKLYACMMMFFMANMIEGQLVSSGAFEISLNNIPLWSKLETGRIPQPPELFQIIDNTLQFSKIDMPNNNFVQ